MVYFSVNLLILLLLKFINSSQFTEYIDLLFTQDASTRDELWNSILWMHFRIIAVLRIFSNSKMYDANDGTKRRLWRNVQESITENEADLHNDPYILACRAEFVFPSVAEWYVAVYSVDVE